MSFTASAAAPELLRDVEYAQAAGISLRLDGAIPEGNGPFPAAIIVHGGAWVRGDRRFNVEPLFKPLSDAGFAWFSISYRLATDPLNFGLAVFDVQAAVRYLKAHAAEYRIDPTRIVLIGESAGGHLASMAALGNAEGCAVRAVVAMYTPSDLVALAKTSDLIPQSIRQQLHGTPWATLILGRLAQLSPIESLHAGMPPFLLIHGTSDSIVPIEQSRTMCERMNAAGGKCTLFTVPGAGHGIRWWESRPAIAEPYKREMVHWLQEQVGVHSAD